MAERGSHRRLALATGLAVAALAGIAPAHAEDVKLGVLLSLSGNVAETGRESERGIQLALEEFSKANRFKGASIALTEVDDASDANNAVVGVQRLGSAGVVGIVGGTVSNAVRAALPVAQRAHLPFVVVNAYTAGLTDIGENVFQVSKPTDDFNKQEVAAVAARLHPKKAAILWAQDNPTTVDFRKDFITALQAANIPVVVDEAMKALDTDFTAQVTKAQQEGADLLIPDFNAPQNAAVIKQAHAIGYTPINIGHVGDVSGPFTSTGGKDVVGHIANSPFFAGGSSAPVVAFVAAYKAKYGTTPTTPAALGYQAMRETGEAIGQILDKGEKVSSDSLRAALNNLGTQPSVMGSSGKAQFAARVLQYDGYVLTLNADMQWQEWK